MGLILKKNIGKDYLLGVWKVTETLDEFLCKINLTNNEQQEFLAIRNEERKKHWLSTRLLVKSLLGIPLTIEHDENGKPFLKHSDYSLSISHSRKYVAIITGMKKSMGIDIEIMSSKIKKIAHKFISTTEFNYLSKYSETEQMYIIWGAKEAMYKLYGKKKIIFKEDMNIAPFVYSPNGGIIQGEIKDFGNYLLQYETIENYILVYIIPN